MADISWHVEATSKCTLECPLCDRTWFYEKFKKREIHEIDIEMLKNFLGKEANVTFCGNNGDPIYHSKFLELCEELKKQKTRISITTNGSGKSHAWFPIPLRDQSYQESPKIPRSQLSSQNTG